MGLIKPEVYAPLTREKYEGRVVIRNLAKDCGYLENTQVGAKVIFPSFKLIGDVEDMTDWDGSQELKDEQMDQMLKEATVKQIGKSVFIRDLDDVTALGNMIGEASEQTGIKIARKVDTDLIAEALTSKLKVAVGDKNGLKAGDINMGLQMFGDEADVEDIAGIVINSLVINSMLNMPEFVDANKTFNMAGNGVQRKGLLGYFRSIPVFVSDKGTFDKTTSECISFIIKKGALAYMEKRAIKTEEDRRPKAGGSSVVANLIYAVKLVNDEGVVVLRKTVADGSKEK